MTSLAPDLDPITTATDQPTHEHAWSVESRHRTSIGHLLYVRCAECGTRRVDVQSHVYEPPIALSRHLGSADAAAVRG
ncbi:hypothetical protein [Micropruina sonneratiae]|uniref:hypothetical protein n=1 Tax=Micropruina sonneratiae TaxID=2986940 RepID=UPI0022278390|nr:hypothetical protein [Micropruina sp. KQZ13P-5]MCW3157678.1 hypothetical protein [Micropruina sp. KQZ13P-5]